MSDKKKNISGTNTEAKSKHGSIRTKITLVFVIFAVLMIVAASLITYIHYSNAMDSHYRTLATNLAETGANSLDPDMVARYSRKILDIYQSADVKVDSSQWGTEEFDRYMDNFEGVQDDPDYEAMYDILSRIRVANEITSIYITYVYNPDRIGFYVVDGSDPEETLTPGVYDNIYEGNEGVLDNPEISFPAYISNTEEYGWLASAGRPIYSADGSEVVAHVLVDISMDEIMEDRYKFIRLFILILLLVSAVAVFGIIIMVNHGIISPIRKLSDAANSYVEEHDKEQLEENIEHFKSLGINTGDEISDLSSAMVKMETDITQYIHNLGEVMADRERVFAELNVGTQIQADMLPRKFPPFPEHTEFEIYATMDPAKEVGGDFYDFFLLDEKHIALVMADVSGKGVPAALFMVISKTLIKNRTQMGGSPAEILYFVNNQLCEGNEAGLFVTTWLAIINLETGEAVSANAGHEHPAIRRGDGHYELFKTRHSLAVACMEGMTFREERFTLNPGDSLFAYTDGVAEATNAYNELFGTDRMLDALNLDPMAKPEETLKNVKAAIDEFVGEAPQFDDITMLSFDYFGKRA